jgi:hypothetical protein
MSLLDLFALSCATSSLVLAWLQPNGLFAELLLKIDAWGSYTTADFEGGVPRWVPWIKNKIAYGLQCRICLSFHFAFWLAVFFIAPSFFCSPELALLVKLPLYSLAATRIAIFCFESDV